MKKKFLFWTLLTIIFAVGFCLRFLYLNTPLWYDEAWSWVTAMNPFPFGITDNLLNEDLQHTPLYFFLLHFWIKLFSQSEIAMRSLSLIFGVLSLPLVYIISNKLFDRKTALYSLGVCAVSPLLVLFSSEVRMYPMVVFLVLLSLNFLIDFEKGGKTSSLTKMTCVNVLIPYTLTGGIFYNFSLLISYLWYLLKNKKETSKKFVIAEVFEWLLLIPYFIMVSYYAKARSLFIISHEGVMRFSDIVDVIRNFFGAVISPNVYWPSGNNYELTFLFALLVIVPCVYFVCGFIKTTKISDAFVKTLCAIFYICFGLSVVFAMLKINVLTVRYILYILPPVLILGVYGIVNNFKKIHSAIFLGLFITASLVFSYMNSKIINTNKERAFKSPAIECEKLGIDYRDVLIMPFGSDAPYYFRSLTAPVVVNTDLHKIVRSPYGVYYDDSQREAMKGKNRYKFILERINKDEVFSQSFIKYFEENIASKVDKGRYVVLVMYGNDNNIIRPVEELRKNMEYHNDMIFIR